MELNDNNKETYIQLLIDSLGKKLEVLNELMQITASQQTIIESEGFDEDEFLKTISLKEEHIQSLFELDKGFEMVYDRIREELNENRKEYAPQITSLKELVTKVTDLSVKLQALETRNKSKLEALLAKKRRSIKNSRLSNETVTNYYKNLANKSESQSYFYDKKK
jgi:flagellar biosynthesis/type III secretory pathway chaperone